MVKIKAHVRDDKTATIVCPSCGAAKHVAAEKFRNHTHTIKARCRCKEVLTVQFNFRRHYRKATNLPGTYIILSDEATGGGVIHVRNVSRGGLGFTVSGRHNIKKGLIIGIEFNLNDKGMTLLRKKAVVKSLHDNYIGCEFTNRDELEKALGFYLQQ